MCTEREDDLGPLEKGVFKNFNMFIRDYIKYIELITQILWCFLFQCIFELCSRDFLCPHLESVSYDVCLKKKSLKFNYSSPLVFHP